ncbi:AI-2E family transporter [Planctomicrobium sp. SH661]|uniref:AI-2E family transporter n=1 Tax=Planctomicrobium sp. SH661 TaxID=3448124 RepID=UPI003F5BD322
MRNMPRLVSMAVLLLFIVILGMTFFRVVAPFALPLFLAAMTAIVCQPVYRYFLRRTKNNVPLAAGLTTLGVLATGLVPLLLGVLISSLQLYTFASQLDQESVKPVVNNVVHWTVDHANRYLPEENQLKVAEVAQNFSAWLRTSLTEIGDKSLGNAAGTTIGMLKGAAGFVVKLAIGLIMFSIALYYFFADGTKLIAAGESLVPVNIDYQREMLDEFSKVVRSVVIATFLAALSQGLATTLAIGVLGFHHLVALFALATFGALIPLMGTWLVWMPCAIWLYSHGSPVQATILVLYCIIFVGLIDNLIRTYVLNSNTKLHPLLAFISVLGGIEAMGLWGVFIGPIVACCLHALVKIFNVELRQLSRDRFQLDSTPVPALAGVDTPIASISEDPSGGVPKTPAAVSAISGDSPSE